MILDAIFDNSKSTNNADITNSTFDNNHQFYLFYVSLSSFVNLLFDFLFDQLFDHRSIINRSISLNEIH
jgi:hypothetical protein